MTTTSRRRRARRALGVLVVLPGLSVAKVLLDDGIAVLFQPNPIMPRWPLWLALVPHLRVFVSAFLITRSDAKDYFDQF